MSASSRNSVSNIDVATKVSRSKNYEESFFLNDGEILLFKNKAKHGDIFQFRMYIATAKRYVFKSTKCTLRNEAIAVAKKMYRDLHHDYDEGTLNFGLNVGKVFEEYKTYLLRRVDGENLRDSTRQRLIHQISQFVKWIGEEKKLNAIKQETLEAYKIHRLKNKLQKDTVLNELIVVRQFLKWMQIKKKIAKDLLFEFEKIKVDKNKRRVEEFTEEEYLALVNTSKNWHKHGKTAEDVYYRRLIHHYIVFLANTGMRTHEVIQLQYRNVVENKNNTITIEIEAEKTKVNKKRLIITERESVINAYRERRKEYSESQSCYLFSHWNEDKKKIGEEVINKSRIYTYFNELKDIVSEKHKDFNTEKGLYSFRHFFITLHLRQKVLSVMDLAQFCGTSISQIEKTYSHIKDEEVSAAVTLSQKAIMFKNSRKN